MEIAGANVVLTGGSRGLGPHIARALLVRGARVTLAARSADDLEKVRASLARFGEVATVAADVSEPEDRAGILKTAEAAHGPVDILVNNAGIESVSRFVDYTPDRVEAIVRTNLESSILLCLLAVPGMVERKRGHIVNVASLAGKSAVPYNTVYSASKHGLVGFSHSLRAELHGTGVGVSVICPGFVAESGMFSRWKMYGKVPRGSGTSTTPKKVVAAVVRAIERNRPEVIVSGPLGKIADVALAISPRMSEAAARRTGVYELLRREAESQARRP